MRLIVLLAALVGLSAAGKERLFKLKPRLSGHNAHSIIIISINMISISIAYTLQDAHSIMIISISMTSINITLQDAVSRVVQSLSLV